MNAVKQTGEITFQTYAVFRRTAKNSLRYQIMGQLTGHIGKDQTEELS